MIATKSSGGPSNPATVDFMHDLRNLAYVDLEAVEVFMQIHNEYHAHKIDLEKALASCGMILLVRTFALLQKFVGLPREGTSEEHYDLTLHERVGDEVQVICIHYHNGATSEVILEKALPGGGIYENIALEDLEMEDVSYSDSDESESDTDESGTPPPPPQKAEILVTGFKGYEEYLRDSIGHTSWADGVRDRLAHHGQSIFGDSSASQDVPAAVNNLAESYSDVEEVQPVQQAVKFTVRNGDRSNSGPSSHAWPSIPAPARPPIIASSSSFFSRLGRHSRDSLFDEDPEDLGNVTAPVSDVPDGKQL